MDLLCPLISGCCNGRVNDGYSTMSDGIFDGIFPILHRTFLLSYFRGCWLLDFSCTQSMWTYNEAAIELANIHCALKENFNVALTEKGFTCISLICRELLVPRSVAL